MKSDLVNIKIYFPKTELPQMSKQKFVSLIMKKMHEDGAIQYAGYLKKKELEGDILGHIGDVKLIRYQPIKEKEKKNIKDVIKKAVEKCHKKLPHPYPPVFVFIYPWFPNKSDLIVFGGVNAFASYHTIHLFLSNEPYEIESIKHTIAHEWNHLVYYKYHQGPYSLKDHLIMEGAAEVFREEVIGGKPALWSTALKNEEIKKQFTQLKSKMNTKSFAFYRKVFWGNKNYKRWTGYSIGYWLVKNFRVRNKNVSWEKTIKMDPESILKFTTK